MQEIDWSELVALVRRRLNANRGAWHQISEDLAKVEGSRASTIYRWMREFAGARYEKVDGGRLQRIAQVMKITVIYLTPLDRSLQLPKKARVYRGAL